ncbi:MAG: hypothetical protein V4653_02055 [Pseudomonadota bacterium]
MPTPRHGQDNEAPRALSVYPDAEFVSRLVSGLPPDLAASFSQRQLFAIQQAFGPWDGQERRKGWRASLRLPWGHYTLSLRRERG